MSKIFSPIVPLSIYYNKVILTAPKSRAGGQERNSEKSLDFVLVTDGRDGRTDGPTRQVLESRVRD